MPSRFTKTDGAYACRRLFGQQLQKHAGSKLGICHFLGILHGNALIEAQLLSIFEGQNLSRLYGLTIFLRMGGHFARMIFNMSSVLASGALPCAARCDPQFAFCVVLAPCLHPSSNLVAYSSVSKTRGTGGG